MVFGTDAFNGILLYPYREIGTEKAIGYISVCQLRHILVQREWCATSLECMMYGDINRLAVDLNTVLFGIRNGDILIGRGIVDIFPVMRQVTERKDKRGSHCIVGGVAEGVLSRDLSCIGEEFFDTVVVILREPLHIKSQKLFIHHKRTVLVFYKCAGAVCSAPVTLSGVGLYRHCKQEIQKQACKKGYCNFLSHLIFLLGLINF